MQIYKKNRIKTIFLQKNCFYNSHAGIFVLINGEPITGAMSFEKLPCGATQQHLLLAIRFCLTEIADRGLIAF
jgi:hypothetical protein